MNNFVFLAEQSFYDGLTSHRAAKDFVIQGGEPDGNGQAGGPGYSVIGELPTRTGVPGRLGRVAEGGQRAGRHRGSQFFIVTGNASDAHRPTTAYVGTVTQGPRRRARRSRRSHRANGDGPPTKTVTIFKVTITITPA